MNKKLFDGIPEYVRITIYAQTGRLLRNSNFIRTNDLDDIIQDLLLFYLENFHLRSIPSKAYVVTSLQNKAKRILKTKVRERFGLSFCLEDITECPEALGICDTFSYSETNLFIASISRHLSDKENQIIKMILDGKTLDDIAKNFHISKNSIYKLFDKIKNFCKN